MAHIEWTIEEVGSNVPDHRRKNLKDALERLSNDGWEIFSVTVPETGGLYEILAHKTSA
jgi:hypothetical protein